MLFITLVYISGMILLGMVSSYTFMVLLQTRLVAINTDLNRCSQSGHVTSILSPRMINFKPSGLPSLARTGFGIYE